MSVKSGSLVLFDIDGTLMRGAGPHHKQALIDGIQNVTGRSTTLEGVDTAGMLDRDLITLMLRASGQSARDTRTKLGEIMRACQTSYLENCAPNLSSFLCRGVKSALAELQHGGAALGLVTGNLSGIGWKKVELAGIRPYFSIGGFAEDGRTRARVAQVAAWRARRLGIAGRKSRISLVGDHANDVAAAKANGYRAVAVASGVMSFEDLAATKPDILVHHLEELEWSDVL